MRVRRQFRQRNTIGSNSRILVVITLLCFYSLSTLSCGKAHHADCSFYYWRTVFKLSAKESEVIKENKVSRLYVRFFDVVDGGLSAEPSNIIRFEEKSDCVIVPVVFIRSNVMSSSLTDPDDLSAKIYNLCSRICSYHGFTMNEIQLDCDWTAESRDRYFELVRALKRRREGLVVSATIRLHQVKYYAQTGIPEVDYGVLMYYNMSQIGSGRRNSIFDAESAGQYTASLKHYPLKLQIALPMFSWSLVCRDSAVTQILPKTSFAELNNERHFRTTDSVYFKAQHPQFFHDRFLPDSTVLKYEGVNARMLVELALQLSSKLRESPEQIIFYDLDERNLNNLPYEKGLLHSVVHSL